MPPKWGFRPKLNALVKKEVSFREFCLGWVPEKRREGLGGRDFGLSSQTQRNINGK